MMSTQERQNNVGKLFQASIGDNTREITSLLSQGVDPNATTFYRGDLPLHQAVWNNNIQAVKILLEYNADPNITNDNGLSPFRIAVRWGYTDIVKLMLMPEFNADINQVDQFSGKTLLHDSSINGHIDVFRLLIEHGSNIYSQKVEDIQVFFKEVCAHGQHQIVKELFKLGLDPKMIMNCNIIMDPPLFAAAENGFAKVIQVLLSHGFNPNQRTQLVCVTDTIGKLPIEVAIGEAKELLENPGTGCGWVN